MLAPTDRTASGHEGCKKPKGIPINESALRDVEAAAIGQQVPASYSGRAFVEAGGLMSYETNYADMCRQVGLYAAGLLKGAKPMDLPVMQATRFGL